MRHYLWLDLFFSAPPPLALIAAECLLN